MNGQTPGYLRRKCRNLVTNTEAIAGPCDVTFASVMQRSAPLVPLLLGIRDKRSIVGTSGPNTFCSRRSTLPRNIVNHRPLRMVSIPIK
ncbi:hypothetical protein J6590_012014 [Homalodisca vitripennis]|nr:hypothetical protein J6590_012014 [Homalodisca vitripennis]